MSLEPKLQCLDGGICFIYRIIFNISVVDIVLQAQQVLQQAKQNVPIAAVPEHARCLRRLENALIFVEGLAVELADSTVLKWLLGQLLLILSMRNIQHCCQTLHDAMSQQGMNQQQQAAATAGEGSGTSTVINSPTCPHSDGSVPATAAAAAAAVAGGGSGSSLLQLTQLPGTPYEPHIPLRVFRWRELLIGAPLGSGAQGNVYAAWLKGTQVAVKEIVLPDDVLQLQQRMTKEEQRQLLIRMMEREAQLMAAGQHPHILSCIGVCYDPPAIIMERCKAGSLHMNLHKYKRSLAQQRQQQQRESSSNSSIHDGGIQQQLFTPASVLKLLHQAASAMAVLHNSVQDGLAGGDAFGDASGDSLAGDVHPSPPLLHCDVRAANLLLHGNLGRPEEWTLKVADFGLAQWVGPDGETAKAGRITHPLWVAPEVIDSLLQPIKQQQQQQSDSQGQVCPGQLPANSNSSSNNNSCGQQQSSSYTMSKASDVYAFGCVLWEVLTGRVPYLTDSVNHHDLALWDTGIVHPCQQKGALPWPTGDLLLPGFNDQLLLQLRPLFEACSDPDPHQRPCFEEIQFWLAALIRRSPSAPHLPRPRPAAAAAASTATAAGAGAAATAAAAAAVPAGTAAVTVTPPQMGLGSRRKAAAAVMTDTAPCRVDQLAAKVPLPTAPMAAAS